MPRSARPCKLTDRGRSTSRRLSCRQPAPNSLLKLRRCLWSRALSLHLTWSRGAAERDSRQTRGAWGQMPGAPGWRRAPLRTTKAWDCPGKCGHGNMRTPRRIGAWESEPGDSTPATRGVGAREEPRGRQQSAPGPTPLAGTVPSL